MIVPDLSDYGLKLDEEFVKKRQNRILMKEKEQPRDQNGHFAPKDGAAKKTKKTTSKKSSKEEPTTINYKKAYEQDEEIIRKLSFHIDEKNRELEAMHDELVLAHEANINLVKKAEMWRRKAAAYFATIEAQSKLLNHVDMDMLTWCMDHLSIWTHIRHSKHICRMVRMAEKLRNCVTYTMMDW